MMQGMSSHGAEPCERYCLGSGSRSVAEDQTTSFLAVTQRSPIRCGLRWCRFAACSSQNLLDAVNLQKRLGDLAGVGGSLR